MILPGELHYQPQFLLPYVSAMATATVEYIAHTYVLVKLVEIEGLPTLSLPGIIHREDTMYGIKDEHHLHEMFSPGDVLIGRVLSLSNSGPIVLSTADPAHGIITAVDFTTQKRLPIKNGQITQNGNVLKRKLASL
ncbi:exosome complex component CSL4 [Nematocida homosporus]|uniref:exosome complex component CSL4 n=1 Tax=Nematocida homosporus TaxID=1912981 RepID=UPI002220761D|nr:exosome complex component CSL4 [Nematocida homosporus]KAI5185879.1 exosome complex component CSL4 [Nematocida homosporus]